VATAGVEHAHAVIGQAPSCPRSCRKTRLAEEKVGFEAGSHAAVKTPSAEWRFSSELAFFLSNHLDIVNKLLVIRLLIDFT
jgi:hypothetical protein